MRSSIAKSMGWSPSPPRLPRVARTLGQEIAIVLLERNDPSVHYDTLTFNDAIGPRMLMDHLFEMGTRKSPV